jgi:hypothetical protein
MSINVKLDDGNVKVNVDSLTGKTTVQSGNASTKVDPVTGATIVSWDDGSANIFVNKSTNKTNIDVENDGDTDVIVDVFTGKTNVVANDANVRVNPDNSTFVSWDNGSNVDISTGTVGVDGSGNGSAGVNWGNGGTNVNWGDDGGGTNVNWGNGGTNVGWGNGGVNVNVF